MTFLIVVHLTMCVALIGIILLQPGKSDMGIGFGSSSQSIFGSKGAGNFLTKVTSIAALIFVCTSFFLTRSRLVEAEQSVIGSTPAPIEEKKAPEKMPAAPETPAEPAAPEKK
ncbi:MAG: preprotein translocase subunit SecG [Bdellovibrionota bacterium]